MTAGSLKTAVILNPAAGGGKAGRQWPALRRALGSVEAARTTAPGDAIALTRRALRDGAERIVAVGGDGTFNEVVNGFFDADGTSINPEAVLVPVTCGTGGDFRRTTGAPVGPGAAAAALADGRIRRIDAGRVTYTAANGSEGVRHFLNVASFGMGGVVDRRVQSSPLPAWAGGTAKFFWAILQTMVSYRNQGVALTVDGVDAGCHRVRNVAVANGRCFGGGLRVAPEARLDDGLLDVIVLGDFSRWGFVRHIGRLYAGTHLALRDVSALRGRTVTATTTDLAPVLLDIDGEPLGRLPARFEVLPGALRLQC